jgi:hypothetical protein
MPLFKCTKCGTVENTALSACSWVYSCEGKPVLCSECCSGKWHGMFKKSKKMPKGEEDYFKKNK